jgi:hypothetical protein
MKYVKIIMNKIKQILKSKFRTGLKTLPYFIIAILVGVTVVYAGNLTPPGIPAKTMKSLSDLYELINTGANTPSTDFTTPATVAPTMHSLGDTYDLLATKISNIDTTKILTGTTIFGKDGSAVAGVDTSDANATAGDIISPKTAYVNGVKLTGTATAGTPAPTFALADATTYSCEALATDLAQPAVTLQTICGYHTGDGCSWSGSACTGGTKTPANGYMTWYAGTASCSEKTDEGSTDWRLPTYPELVGHYLDHNNAGAPPTGFVGDGYWSGATCPGNSGLAYYVYMGGGYAYGGNKSNPSNLVRCAH